MPPTYSPGDLGKLAICNVQALKGMGWHNYFYNRQHPTSIHPDKRNIPHPTAAYLTHLADAGVLAVASPQWTKQQLHQAYPCDPHPSAARHYTDFLIQDMYEYALMGYWTVLPTPSTTPMLNVCHWALTCHAIWHYVASLAATSVYCDPRDGPPLLAKVQPWRRLLPCALGPPRGSATGSGHPQ